LEDGGAAADAHCSTRLPPLSTRAMQAGRPSTLVSPVIVETAPHKILPSIEHCSTRASDGIDAVLID